MLTNKPGRFSYQIKHFSSQTKQSSRQPRRPNQNKRFPDQTEGLGFLTVKITCCPRKIQYDFLWNFYCASPKPEQPVKILYKIFSKNSKTVFIFERKNAQNDCAKIVRPFLIGIHTISFTSGLTMRCFSMNFNSFPDGPQTALNFSFFCWKVEGKLQISSCYTEFWLVDNALICQISLMKYWQDP